MIPLSWLRRKPIPPFAAAYCDRTPTHLPRKTPIDQVRFVVVDIETSGFDPGKDRILSLAALPVQGGRLAVAGARSWLIYHPNASMNEAVRVHGILPSETRTGEPEAAVLQELLAVITGAVVVGHHIGFDVRMLNEALEHRCNVRLRNPTLDTAVLAMHTLEAFRKTGYPGQRAPSLDEVCTHCGIAPLERHTAPGDAFTTAELLMVLCAKRSRQLGRALTVADLPLERA